MRGAIYLFGLLLLLATIVGSRWVIEGQSNQPKTAKTPEELAQLPEYIVCWGNFDVADGTTPLSPKQTGDIVYLISENTFVKKGTPLLKLADAQAKLTVELAQADVTAGKHQVEEAKLLTEKYKQEVAAQESALRAIDLEMKRLDLEKKSKLDQLDPGQPIRKTLEEMYDVGVSKLKEMKTAEKAKLAVIKLQNAQLKIDQAKADLTAKETRLKQAQELLSHYQIVAPTDGTVLRTHVHNGETVTPMARTHAIDFLPEGKTIVRAEVLQEWGRYVAPGLEVEVQDDIYQGKTWKGKVRSVSNWYAPTRIPTIEPFRYNDVRTLECIVDVESAEDARIGQRVRAKIKIPPQTK